jgi:hypothetical protein
VEYERILQTIAPCGLNCVKCLAFVDGEIRLHAAGLKRLLGSFDRYAARFSGFMPVFGNYTSFKDLLDLMANGSCRGCRSGDCIYPNCGVASCYREKKVDFCFQCDEFPCDRTNFDDDLKRRWRAMNMRMKQVGIEAYVEETKDVSRYV